MAKTVKAIIKLNLAAGAATAAPPAGPALGQHGVPIMDFIKKYNEATAKERGKIIPVVITVYDDRSFTFITKLPPASELIKQRIKLQKGSPAPGKEVAATMTDADVTAVAEEKMKDLNATTLEQAKKVIAGSARSMGIKVQNG